MFRPLCQPSSLPHIPGTGPASFPLVLSTLFAALTRISSQVEGDVTIQETIFLEFIFIVQVIDFKLLHVSRDLGPSIPLDTLVGKADRSKNRDWYQLRGSSPGQKTIGPCPVAQVQFYLLPAFWSPRYRYRAITRPVLYRPEGNPVPVPQASQTPKAAGLPG